MLYAILVFITALVSVQIRNFTWKGILFDAFLGWPRPQVRPSAIPNLSVRDPSVCLTHLWEFYLEKFCLMHFLGRPRAVPNLSVCLSVWHTLIYLERIVFNAFSGTTATAGSSLCCTKFIRPSVCLSDFFVICDHTFQLIETILVSLGSPKILVSENCKFAADRSLLIPQIWDLNP